MMQRVLLLGATLMVVGALAGGATASPSTHILMSNNWQGVTFVGGLGSCPLFGETSSPWYAFDNVDLTDHLDISYTASNEPLDLIDSVGAVHGVMNAPDGTYTVAGGGFKERRTGFLAPWYFSGAGQVTITGPAGTVVGQAIFQDLTQDPPAEFDLNFTNITTCRLRSR